MFFQTRSSTETALNSLRQRWFAFVVASLLALVVGFLWLYQEWNPTAASRWLGLAAVVQAYLAWIFLRSLGENRRMDEDLLLPTLGLGNMLTLLRGTLIAGLAGFLLSPAPPGGLAWLPGILYILACLADYLDGFAARVTDHATHLGEILDMSFDGIGVLVGGLLAIRYGKVPSWYLLVALARYLFLLGTWLRIRWHKPVFELKPSASRRTFAGLQMGFIAAMLLPVFTAPGTQVAAAFAALPFLVGFSRDWLAASGFQLVFRAGRGQAFAWLQSWFPILLRVSSLVLALNALAEALRSGAPFLVPLIAAALACLIFIGGAARTAAISGLILLSLAHPGQLEWIQYLQIIVYVNVLFLGSGNWSVWTPENYLIDHPAGEVNTELRIPARQQLSTKPSEPSLN